MADRVTIVGSPVSPYVRKVLAVCAVKGIAVEIDPISPFVSSDAFAALSPLRRIPVLIDGDLILSDSSVIAEYLEETRPTPPLWPADPIRRARARWIEEYADTRVADILIWRLFFQLGLRPRLLAEETDQAMVDRARDVEAPALFDDLEARMPEVGFLFGALSIADLSLAPHFLNAAAVKVAPDVQRHPRLTAWLARVQADTPLGDLNTAARALLRLPLDQHRDKLPDLGLTPAAHNFSGTVATRGPMTV